MKKRLSVFSTGRKFLTHLLLWAMFVTMCAPPIVFAVGPFIPGAGGTLPAFTPFSAEENKIGGLYVEYNQKKRDQILGIRNNIDLKFWPPSTFGATSYTLQYSENGTDWLNYQSNDEDVTTLSNDQDNFSLVSIGGNYQFRLLVNGGLSNGYTSNQVDGTLSLIDSQYTGWELDESMSISPDGTMAPFVGRGLEASFSGIIYGDPDVTFTDEYLTYQWYRVNPVSYEMTAIEGATDLTYITTADDAGYDLLIKATGDGTNVGGSAQILSSWETVIPNDSFVSNISENGFTLNLDKSVTDGLSKDDLELIDGSGSTVTITDVVQGENAAIYDISADLSSEPESLTLNNNSDFWRISSSLEGGFMRMEGITFETSAIEEDFIADAFTEVYNALVLEGIESNLNTITSENYTSFTGLYFEKRTDVSDPSTALGRITFDSALDLSDTETQTFLQNLGTKMNMDEAGVIGLDFTGATDALALKGVSATIRFYGLDDLGFDENSTAEEINAKMLAYDDEGNLIDISTLIPNVGTYVGACEPEETECYYYSVGVNHFTQYEIDNIAPIISETTPVTTPDTDDTPDYTFTSDEAGLITYGGDCSSTTTGAIVGENTITFDSLSVGTHNNCTITVTDIAANTSNTLNVTEFEIQIPAPTFANTYQITDVGNISNYDVANDSSNDLHIVYESGGYIYYQKNDETAELIGTGSSPIITLHNDVPHLLFVDAGKIKYSTKANSSWSAATDLTGAVSPSSLDFEIDSNGFIHLVYSKNSTENYDDIFYSTNTSGSFVETNICHGYYWSGFGGLFCGHPVGIKIDSNDKYHIAYISGWRDSTPTYSTQNMAYTTNSGDDSGSSGFNWNSAPVTTSKKNITLNSNENPEIMYISGGNLYKGSVANGNWTETTIGSFSSPAIESNLNTTGIAYVSGTDIQYIENNGSGFTNPATLDTGSNPIVSLGERTVAYLKTGDIYVKTNHSFIDLTPPTAINLGYTNPLINKSNALDGFNRVEVNYNEPMDETINPTIAYSSPAPARLETGACSGHWETSTQYFFNCDLYDDNEEISDIDIIISGAKDLAGNEQLTAVFTAYFSIDTVLPVSTADAGEYTYDTWSNNDVTITFECTDAGSGCEITPNSNQYPYHCIDTDNTCYPNTATHDVILSEDGVWYVRYLSIDVAENDEITQSKIVKIDKTNPTGSINSPTASTLLKETVTIEATANDTDGSGIARVEFWHNSVGTKIGEDSTAPYSVSWNTAQAPDGDHTLSLKIFDNAGNNVTSEGVAITVDNTPPTNQNTVFSTNTTAPASSEITVVSSGETGGSIWFAPAGTTNFEEGQTMTSVDALETSIYAPSAVGVYKLFVIDAAGNISSASTASLTTTETNPPELVSASAVAVNKIEVNFNEDLDGLALNIADFKVTVGETEFEIGSLSENNGKVTLNLTSNLLTSDTPLITINPNIPRTIKDIFGNIQAEKSGVIAADKIAPTVIKIGNDSEDVTIAATTTKTLIFSEAISTTGKLTVQKALTTGANKVLTYAWNGGNNILTITGHATDTTTFANDVVVSIKDLAGNSATLLLIDSKLESTQVTPSGTGTTTATINNTTSKVVITNPILPVVVTITSGTTNPTIDVSSFIGSTGSGVLPQITINSSTANVGIPDVTTVTSADPAWDGVIAAPTVTTVDLPSESGQTKTLSSAIEIGFTGAKLSFDKGVRILIPGQAGKKAGYVRTGTTFTEITTTCSADNQATGDALAVDGDCKIDVGSDLVVWTKHFTKFATYSQTTNSSSGGGGSVSFSVSPYQLPAIISSTIANIFNRGLDLSKTEGMTARGILMKNTDYGIILEIPQSTKITTKNGIYKGIISKPDRLSIRSTPVLPIDYQKIFGAEIKTDTAVSFDKMVKLTLPVEMPERTLPENVKVFYYDENLKQYQLIGEGGVLSADKTSITVEIDHLTKFVVMDTKGKEAVSVAPETIAENINFESIEFTDIKGHWGYSYIKRLQNTGVVKGKKAGIFEPDTTTTRAELTKMVLLAFGYEITEKITTSGFEDVDVNAWYAPYIAKAKEIGLIEGYADGTFKPNQEINRVEALKIMLTASALKIEGGEMDFNDTIQGSWYEKYVAYAKIKGIIEGYSDKTFGPEKNITRAEFAKIIVKTIDLK